MRLFLYVLVAAAVIAFGVGLPIKLTLKAHSLSAELGSAEAKGGNGNGGGNAHGGGNGSGEAGGHDKATGEKKAKADAATKEINGALHADNVDSWPATVFGPYFRVRLVSPQANAKRPPSLRRGAPPSPARSISGKATPNSGNASRREPGGRTLPAAISRKPGQPSWIVAAGLTPSEIERLSARGFTVTRTTTAAQSMVVKFQLPAGMSLKAARRAVSRVNVRAVSDADAYYYTDGSSADCASIPCGAVQVQWSGDSCGAPPVIGMIDTRIDTGHQALAGQAIEVVETAGTSPRSSADHGTAIAALLAGRRESDDPGLLPSAQLVAVDAFAIEDGVERADVVRPVDALEALWHRGVRIVNLSFSGPPQCRAQAGHRQGVGARHGPRRRRRERRPRSRSRLSRGLSRGDRGHRRRSRIADL
jgi:hypothetical protein